LNSKSSDVTGMTIRGKRRKRREKEKYIAFSIFCITD